MLSYLETHNAELIRGGMQKAERLEALRRIAQYPLRVLDEAGRIKELSSNQDERLRRK